MPTIKELVAAGIAVPTWLRRAEVKNEDVMIDAKGVVTWKGGAWLDGCWEDGIWKTGSWRRGVWERGVWQEGIWVGGTWRRGTWRNGLWKGGEWWAGTWKDGEWQSGTWCNGTWEKGIWKGGVWKGGKWLGGSQTARSKYIPTVDDVGSLGVGCRYKPDEDWLEWLSSTEEYETPRDTEDFKLIEAHIISTLWYKAMISTDEKLKGKLIGYAFKV